MKTATLPSLRVEPELRDQIEAVLKDGETLSAFMEDAVRSGIRRRNMQRDFLAKTLAAEQEAEAAGYHSAEDVLRELEEIVSQAEHKARPKAAS